MQPLSTLTIRPRRNRKSKNLRALVQENRLSSRQLVAPFFLVEGENKREPLGSMPHVCRYSIDQMLRKTEAFLDDDIRSVLLFAALPEAKKDPLAKSALSPDCLLYQGVSALKREFPELTVMVDIALDPFTDHGHDGLVSDAGEILNDETLVVLAEMALLAADSGCDVVAPSDMMDGRVGFIRTQLDKQGFTGVSILSYAAKYASSFYGPFRDALGSAPKFGDKKTYQLNPANVREALLEATLDVDEGADFLLVKPALPYLDVLAKIKENVLIPVGAYHVSGEYAMAIAAHERGWVDGKKVLVESLLSIKRAGADFILTYAMYYPDLLPLLAD